MSTNDRASLKVTTTLTAMCRDRDTSEWFREAKSRTEDRLGRQLTHEEFTRLLLEIYEFHEDRERDRERGSE